MLAVNPCAGLIFGVSSSAMLHTTLAHWLSVPPTYEGLLLDSNKKSGGVLKKKASDIKTGPLMHASGQHFDGDRVRVAVQVSGWGRVQLFVAAGAGSVQQASAACAHVQW